MLRLDQRLMADHERLEGLFTELLDAARSGDWPTVRRAWSEFESGVRAHFDAEESYLLPRFDEKAPDVARTIRAEHAQIRKALAELGVATDLHLLRLDIAEELVRTLREHAARETESLYPWAERSVEEADKARVVDALARK
jgi:hemerythrin superfamily protein